MAQLLYFAWLREQLGKSEETVNLPDGVKTVADLIAHLRARGGAYDAALADISRIRVAVNQSHVHANHPVMDSDEIAFFPPVTGG